MTAKRPRPSRTPLHRAAALLAGLLILALPAPARSAPPASPAAKRTLTVAAAASLTEAFTDLAAEFEREQPGVRVRTTFAGSQVLRTQIEHGAPVDVFASADLAHLEALAAAELVRAPRVFARNRLVVIASPASRHVKALADLSSPNVDLVIGAPEVPVGRYTEECFAKMDATGFGGPGFVPRVRANVRSRETNVRGVTAKVALGEAHAGIVYRTDVRAVRDLRVIEIPEAVNVVAVLSIAVVAASGEPDLAAAFVDRVFDARGRALLARHGFEP